MRALVSLNRTDFFLDMGRPRGLQVEALEGFERYLNEVGSRPSFQDG